MSLNFFHGTYVAKVVYHLADELAKSNNSDQFQAVESHPQWP